MLSFRNDIFEEDQSRESVDTEIILVQTSVIWGVMTLYQDHEVKRFIVELMDSSW